MYKSEIVCPKPSNIPLNEFDQSPNGLNPVVPQFAVSVFVTPASIFLPNSYFPFSA